MLKRLLLSATALTLFAGSLSAEVDPQVLDEIRQRLKTAIPGLVVTNISESSIPGLYEVQTNGQETLFTSKSGDHVVVGELFRLDETGVVNVSEERRSQERAARLEALPAEQMISFKPAGETKAVVNVFTDIDCPYCRKLHDEVPDLNAMGIQVNYLAFPRSGPNTPSFNKAVSAWCADDRQEAMNQAKSGKAIPAKDCDDPVAEHFRLGTEIGVTGTPAIILEDGTMIRGYLPKDRLARALDL